MGNVTKISVNKFINGESFTASKSNGNMSSNGTSLFLHGNEIAKKDAQGHYWVSNAGWSTNTTKERLNGLLDALGSKYYIASVKFEWALFNRSAHKKVYVFIPNGIWIKIS